MSSAATTRIAENLAAVRQRIDAAARRSGRSADEITLVGVSKYVDAELTRALYLAGCHDLGESRPQQLWAKAEQLAELPVRWHQIGQLQRNKVKRTLPLLALLHAVDSPRLLDECEDVLAGVGKPLTGLLEVNISGDPAKHGFKPEELEPLLNRIGELQYLQIGGLMAMAGLGTGPTEARRDFARLRELRDALQKVAPTKVQLPYLSMGMSSDFEEAILEGATHVRVGSSLFEGVLA